MPTFGNEGDVLEGASLASTSVLALGGKDGSGNATYFKLDAQGRLEIVSTSTQNYKDDAVIVPGGPHTTLNFSGSDFTVSDAGGGEATVTVDDAGIDHDATTNFVANEHVNHSSVVLTAGTGLTGGGDITLSRTFNVIGANSIVANANDIQLVNDVGAPGANQVYGTDGAGVKGWQASSGGMVFGQQFAFTENLTTANTTSTTPVTFHTMNYTPNVTGNYMIQWSVEHRNTLNDAGVDTQVNHSAAGELMSLRAHSTGVAINPLDDFSCVSGHAIVAGTATVQFTITIARNAVDAGEGTGTAVIRRARVSIWRVS